MPKETQLGSRPPTRDGKDILNVLYETWRDETRGQKIIGAWIGGLFVASIWGIYIKRKLKISAKKDEYKPKITRKLPSSFLLKSLENSNVNDEDSKMDREISLVSRDSDDIDDDNETPQDINDSNKNNGRFSTFRGVLDIGINSIWCSPILWSTLLSTSLIWKTSNISAVNDCIGSMGELLVIKKWKLLSLKTMDFATKTVYASIAVATVKLLSDLLSLSLRDNVTRYILDKYDTNEVTSCAFLYHTTRKINHIDARICSDINKWSICYSDCFISFCKPMIDVTLYSNKLIERIGARYFTQCMFYFVISSMWTRSILPSYSLMKKEKSKYEAIFHKHNQRIVEFVEEIHFLHGINAEIYILNNAYYKLYNKLSSISIYDSIYTFCQNYMVRYCGILVSFISLLPMIKNEKKPTEFLLNNLHDLVNIGLAFRDLMKSSKQFDELKGISARIMELVNDLEAQLNEMKSNQSLHIIEHNFVYDDDEEDDIDKINDKIIKIKIKNKVKNIDIYKDDDDDDHIEYEERINNKKQLITFKNVQIETPDKSQLILNNFNFTINAGENVLICGQNGAGKSSLVRCISGLWNISKGKMVINTKLIGKQNDDMYFLPSRTYLVPNLSIKQQLLYPDIDNVNIISDETVIEILNDCGLGQLVDYFSDINDDKSISDSFWSTLSAGERQLICLCRVLIRNIKPKIVFVDEAFSNLAQDKIHWFYNKLSLENITAVSITHNVNNIKQYHDVTLMLNGDGMGSYDVKTT